jgi:hypothetical protein
VKGSEFRTPRRSARGSELTSEEAAQAAKLATCVRTYPARQHLDGAVGAGRGDAEVQHRGDLEAEEPDAAQRAGEGAGPRGREALERAGVEDGLDGVRVPQELADAGAGDAVRQRHALPPPRRQPGPPSRRCLALALARARLCVAVAVAVGGVAACHCDPPCATAALLGLIPAGAACGDGDRLPLGDGDGGRFGCGEPHSIGFSCARHGRGNQPTNHWLQELILVSD